MEVRVELELVLDVPAGQDVRSAVKEHIWTFRHQPAVTLFRFMKIISISTPEPWQKGQGDATVWDDPDE